MATSRNLAQGASNGNSAAGGRRANTSGPQATANKTASATVRAASYIPPVATKPVDADTKGRSGVGSLDSNLKSQTGR